MNRKDSGFTLIELMIVVAIIAIIASIAIPNLLSSRLSANESAAIGTARQVIASQTTFQGQGSTDEDVDGNGEYGYFAEMSGAVGLVRNGAGTPALTPPVLSNAFGVLNAVGGEGAVQRAGYFFKVFLPAVGGAAPLGELPAGGQAAGALNIDNAETLWCMYAWPANRGTTGTRVFFVNQQGEIMQCLNNGAGGVALISGNGAQAITAANALIGYRAGGVGDMTDAIAIGAAFPGIGGYIWVPAGN